MKTRKTMLETRGLSLFVGTALMGLSFLGTSTAQAFTSQTTVDNLFALNNVQTIKSSAIDSKYPTRATFDPNLTHTDLSYWVNTVLPYEKDRSAEAYLVYPKYGIVVPILKPTSADQQRITLGQNFDHYKYLENGALHYFGNGPDFGGGNMAIAAHSSYYVSDPGRYKTVFQALPLTKAGDIVRYFKKNSDGAYDLYEYQITQSFETDKYNVGILAYVNDGRSYITTYGCYPIGTNTKRWVNQGVLIKKTANQSVLNTTVANSVFATDILFPSASNSMLDVGSFYKVATVTTSSGSAPMLTFRGVSSGSKTNINVLNRRTLTGNVASKQNTTGEKDEFTATPKIFDFNPMMVSGAMSILPALTSGFGFPDRVDVKIYTNPQFRATTSSGSVQSGCYTPASSVMIKVGNHTYRKDQIPFQALMYAYGLTKFTNTESFKAGGNLRRGEAAKILVNFAKNMLCRSNSGLVYQEGYYKDIANSDPTLVPYIKEAYALGILKGGKGKFRPQDVITREEFIAGFMRALTNQYLAETPDSNWSANYQEQFKKYGMMKIIGNRPFIQRYDIAKMIYQIYYDPSFVPTSEGFVTQYK